MKYMERFVAYCTFQKTNEPVTVTPGKLSKGELLSGSPDLFVLPRGVITMVQDANCCCIVQLQPEKVQFWRN